MYGTSLTSQIHLYMVMLQSCVTLTVLLYTRLKRIWVCNRAFQSSHITFHHTVYNVTHSFFSNMRFNFLNLFFPILFLDFMGDLPFLPFFFSNFPPCFLLPLDALVCAGVFAPGFLASDPLTVSPSILAIFAFFGPAGKSLLPFGLFAVSLPDVPLVWAFAFKPSAFPGTALLALDGLVSGDSATAVDSGASEFSSSVLVTDTDG